MSYREIHHVLKDIPSDRQEKILRWVCESLDLKLAAKPAPNAAPATPADEEEQDEPPPAPSSATDIKSFVSEKKPRSDMQFAAVAAYYHRFVAPKDRPNRQVRSREDRDTISAIANAWFHSHRKRLRVDHAYLAPLNSLYNVILDYSDRNTTKDAYLHTIDEAKEELRTLRGHLLLADPGKPLDTAPDFSPLVSDPAMRAILERRWYECQRCLSVAADLAAVVMMGGLLEALFVARANGMKPPDRAKLFKCAAAPRDPVNKNKVRDLRDWMLGSYIDVALEMQWITRPAKDIATVLRDYRNYIHPEKERSYGVALTSTDSAMLWDVTRNLARQVLAP